MATLQTHLDPYRDEMTRELTDRLLPFWLTNVLDFGSGGFNGSISGRDIVDPKADKGVILATRILWTFSRAYRQAGREEYRRAADLMVRYLRDHFMDRDHGGVFWQLEHSGKPRDTTKRFYAQSFAIYALSEYSRATGDLQALREARELFTLLEKHGRDPVEGGYLDALGRDWKPIADTRLSEVDLNTPKSMNTNLHVLEAYSDLALHEPAGPVVESLEILLEVFLQKIILPNRHFGLFFDLEWNEVLGNISYGHDIEGSWLLTEAAERTGNGKLAARVQSAALGMAQAVLEQGVDAQGGVLNEREADGKLKAGKEWWMQAEAMVGFYNAYQLTGQDHYLKASLAAWDYSKKWFLRPDGEWYSGINDAGVPDLNRPVSGIWKCPYHTARAYMEIMERIDGMA